MFYHGQVIYVFANNKRLYFHSEEKRINGRFTSLSPLIYASITNTPEHSLQHFITHDQFANLIIFS